MTTYDVVVVGARVAGASTAMLLARAGARVALVDRAPYGTDTLSTHGLMRAGVLQLARWGLLDRVVAAGTPPIRLTTFRYGAQEPVPVEIRPSPGVDALYAPRRHVLDRLLVDAAAEAGADVWHGTRVSTLLRDVAGRVVGVRVTGARVAGARVADGARTREVRARFVVGADGLSSHVAEEVAAPALRRGHGVSAMRYAYYRGLDPTGYEWYYGDGVAAGVIPTNEGLACVFVATSPARMRSLRRGAAPQVAFETLFAAAAPARAGLLASGVRDGAFRGWAGRPAQVRRSWGAGWSLVGDAGYFTDPISSHGMTQALRDADLLAAALLEALAGARSEPAALAGYQRRRDALNADLLRASDRIATYDWDERSVQPMLKQLTAAMADEVLLLESLPFLAAGGRGEEVA